MIDYDKTRKIARILLQEKTFTFIKENLKNRISFFNGYIKRVDDDKIIFYDLKLKRDIPILLDVIEVIEPSRRIKKEDEKRR